MRCLVMAYCAEEFFGVADITGAYAAGLAVACTPKDVYKRQDTMCSTFRWRKIWI